MKNKRMWLSEQFRGKLSSSGFGGGGGFEGRVSSRPVSLASSSKCMAGDDPEFPVHQFSPPKCWDYILGIPHLIWIRGFLEFQ